MPAHNHLTRTVELNLSSDEVAARIGEEYRQMDSEMTPEIEMAAHLLLAINETLYEQMVGDGLSVYDTPDDPYNSYEEMYLDIGINNTLGVFSGGSCAPYMGSIPTYAEHATVVHRAVHDYWGHYKNDVDFSFVGEFSKWHYMKPYYPEICHRLTFADVVGQLAYAQQLPDHFNDEKFEQKAILAPENWIDWCYENLDVPFTR